ncbi:MAG: MFS transporter [Deltaproteobacteria bacterium]|nr:MFS transporter [Deltaproteobacteria bacterium]
MSSKPTIPGPELEEGLDKIKDPGFLKNRAKILLFTAISCNLFGNMGFTALNVAMPDIERDMGLSAPELSWIIMACMLAMAAFSAPLARVSDIVGRRKVTIIGLWVAIAGSIGSALSPNYTIFVLTRALTGIGLITFFTTIMAMVASAYPPGARGKVLGLTIGAVYVSLSMGPTVGGLLVFKFGWESIFWFSAISLVPSLVLIHLVQGEDPLEDSPLDLLGTILWTLALGLGFAGFASLPAPWAIAAMAVGLLLFVVFVLRSFKIESPLIDLSLFTRSRRFTFSSGAAFISYLASFSITMLLSLYFQYSKGLSPLITGFVLTAQPLFQAVLTPIAGRLSDRVDPGVLGSVGLGVILMGILIIAIFISPSAPLPLIITAMCLCGAGFALFSAPNSNAIFSSVPPRRMGQASGVISVMRLTGQISSVAITTLVFSLVIGAGEITPEKYPDFIKATKVLFWIFAPLCFLAILASLARGAPNEAKS